MKTVEWRYGEVEKRGGCWGFFETHIATGRSRFVTFNLRTKREVIVARSKYIEVRSDV